MRGSGDISPIVVSKGKAPVKGLGDEVTKKMKFFAYKNTILLQQHS